MVGDAAGIEHAGLNCNGNFGTVVADTCADSSVVEHIFDEEGAIGKEVIAGLAEAVYTIRYSELTAAEFPMFRDVKLPVSIEEFHRASVGAVNLDEI